MRHEKAEQVLELARVLAANAEGLTLDEIAQRMDVGRRTAERLRDAVWRVFPQMEEKPDGNTKRFYLPGGIESFFNSPTTEELLALSKAVAHFKSSAMKDDGAALERLEQKIQTAMRPQAMRKISPDLEALMRAELIALQAGPRAIEAPEMLASLRDALLRTRVVAFTYSGGSKKGASRKVTPYGIIFGRMNYLVGPEEGATKIKHWRLDRIRDLKMTDTVSILTVSRTVFAVAAWLQATWTARQAVGKRGGDEAAYCRDRVGRVPFRPQRRRADGSPFRAARLSGRWLG